MRRHVWEWQQPHSSRGRLGQAAPGPLIIGLQKQQTDGAVAASKEMPQTQLWQRIAALFVGGLSTSTSSRVQSADSRTASTGKVLREVPPLEEAQGAQEPVIQPCARAQEAAGAANAGGAAGAMKRLTQALGVVIIVQRVQFKRG